MKNNGLAVPQHVANERQIAIAAAQSIANLRVNFAIAIYQRLAAEKYGITAAMMAARAKQELDPLNLGNIDIPDIDIRANVDLNSEAVFSIHAANTLLHHLGVLKAEESAHELLGNDEKAAKIIT